MRVWRSAAVCGGVIVAACGGSSGTDVGGPVAQPDGGGIGTVDAGAPPADAGGGDAALVCGAGTGDCDRDATNGCETSTLGDDAHCGTCPNACASGSSCQAGQCIVGPATVIPGGTLSVNDAVCLGVDATFIYVASGRMNGDVYRVPKAGGSPASIATNQGSPRGVAADATSVFWANGAGIVNAANPDGSSARPLFSGAGGPFAVAVDARGVYWANGAQGTVSRVDKAGTNAKQLAPQPPTPGPGNNHIAAIAVAGGFVYYTDPTAGVVLRVATDGTAAPQTVVAAAPGVRGVAVHGATAYFTVPGSVPAGGSVQSVALGGTLPAAPAPVATGLTNPTTVLADGAALYWILGGMSGSIVKQAGNAAAVPLATSQAFPACMAVDGASLYWINENGAAVMRVAK